MNARALLAVSLLASLESACMQSQVPTVYGFVPGDGGLANLTLSDAVVGGTGLFRVDLVDPVATDTSITLLSSDATVASFAPSVLIPMGHASAEGTYSGLAAGPFVLTASLNGAQLTGAGSVLASNTLISVSAPTRMIAGTTGLGTVSLSLRGTTDDVVRLASSNPAVLAVPATASIQPYRSSASFPVRALTAGTATLTATRGATTTAMVVTVMSTNSLQSVSVYPATVVAGQPCTLQVALAATTASDVTVTLESSDLHVLPLPATSVVVPAGTSAASLLLSGSAAGSVTVTATLAGAKSSAVVQVLQTNALSGLSISPSIALMGQVATARVSLLAIAANDVAVTLESSDPTVATVPSSLVVPAGASSAMAPVTLVAAGQTAVSASLSTVGSGGVPAPSTGPRSTASLQVLQTNGVRYVSCEPVSVNTTAACGVALQTTSIQSTDVTISVSAPTVLLAPTTVTIPAGGSSVIFPVVGRATAGSAQLVATLGTSRYEVTVPVAAAGPPALSQVYVSPTNALVNTEATISIYLATAASADTVVSLSSSNPAVMTPPSTLTVSKGSSYVSTRSVYKGPGFAAITATIPPSQSSSTVVSATAQGTPTHSVYFPGGMPVERGYVSSISVYSSRVGETANVTFAGNPSQVSFAGSDAGSPSHTVAWPTGQSSFAMPVTAVGTGAVPLSVSIGGETWSSSMSIVSRATISSLAAGAFAVSSPATFSIYLNATVASDYPIDLTQSPADGGSIANLPAHVVIPTGAYSLQLSLKGQTSGPVSITATTPDAGSMTVGPFTVGP